MRVAIVVFDGFDELDAIGPYEVLRNAQAAGVDVSVELATFARADRVVGDHGLTVEPQAVLDESFDLVIVPGGGWLTRSEAGAWGEVERGDLPAALARLREEGAAMASVCTGAMVLSAAGITRGRVATTHHGALAELEQAGAHVVRERVVDDGDLVTSGGVTAGIDMALWLVEREWGAELAGAIAREMEHDRVGGIHRRPG